MYSNDTGVTRICKATEVLSSKSLIEVMKLRAVYDNRVTECGIQQEEKKNERQKLSKQKPF